MTDHHYEKFIGFAAIVVIIAIIGYLLYASSGKPAPLVESPATVAPVQPAVPEIKTVSDYLGAPMADISATAPWKTYTDAKKHFSISYPSDWTVNASYANTDMGPGKDRNGVSFTIPASLAKGTNLSTGTLVSVEANPASGECVASDFIDTGATTSFDTVTVNGTEWTIAKGGDAGAGNLYEEIVASKAGTNPCEGVRLFIHSTQIANYDPGTVTAFDRTNLVSIYETMLSSYTAK